MAGFKFNKYKLNWLDIAIESSAADTVSDFTNAGWNYGRKFGVQVLDSTGTPVDGIPVTFELIGSPSTIWTNASCTLKTATVTTASADLNPKSATTITRNGVACLQLYCPLATSGASSPPAAFAEDTAAPTPSSGTYVLKANYGDAVRYLTCHYENLFSPDAALGVVWIYGLDAGSWGSGTNAVGTPKTVASSADIIFNTCDQAHCPLGLIDFTVTFTALSGAYSPTYATGFGLIDPDNVTGPLLETYTKQTSAVHTFPGITGNGQRCGSSGKDHGRFICKIRNNTGGSLNARLDFSAVKAGVTKTLSAWFTVQDAP